MADGVDTLQRRADRGAGADVGEDELGFRVHVVGVPLCVRGRRQFSTRTVTLVAEPVDEWEPMKPAPPVTSICAAGNLCHSHPT